MSSQPTSERSFFTASWPESGPGETRPTAQGRTPGNEALAADWKRMVPSRSSDANASPPSAPYCPPIVFPE